VLLHHLLLAWGGLLVQKHPELHGSTGSTSAVGALHEPAVPCLVCGHLAC
jgi:hypothetical protein